MPLLKMEMPQLPLLLLKTSMLKLNKKIKL